MNIGTRRRNLIPITASTLYDYAEREQIESDRWAASYVRNARRLGQDAHPMHESYAYARFCEHEANAREASATAREILFL